MDSCFSCGNTSRNHPTQPANVKIAPRMLTEALVTNPAKTNVRPKARMIGHVVGAGSSIEPVAVVVRADSSCCSDAIFQYLLHRPITYTTVKTTIHTASTKCQYSDKTSTRSACSEPMFPR